MTLVFYDWISSEYFSSYQDCNQAVGLPTTHGATNKRIWTLAKRKTRVRRGAYSFEIRGRPMCLNRYRFSIFLLCMVNSLLINKIPFRIP